MKKVIFFVLFLVLSIGVFASKEASFVDSRARMIPPIYNDDLKGLVSYLTVDYKADIPKARVLLAYIVYNMDYDQYRYLKNISKSRFDKANSLPPTDSFAIKMGTSFEIAHLYSQMLNMAGIESVVVTGYAGHYVTRSNKDDFRGAWVAAKLNNQWVLIDPTWAISGTGVKVGGDISRDSEYKRLVAVRMRNAQNRTSQSGRIFDDNWFMVKPQDMIKTHFPDNAQWQLLPAHKKIASFLK